MAKLNQKALAKKLGCTAQNVSRLVKTGKLKPGRDGLFDLAKARKALAAWRPRGTVRAAKAQARKAGRASAAARRARSSKSAAEPRAASSAGRLYRAKAAREEYEAELKRMAVEAEKKRLLPADALLAAERRKNANVKTRFRRLGRSLAPALAAISDPGEIEEIILDEVDRLLNELAADPLAELPVESAMILQTSAEGQLPVASCQLPVPPAPPAEMEVPS